jgi:hypothetical protein
MSYAKVVARSGPAQLGAELFLTLSLTAAFLLSLS